MKTIIAAIAAVMILAGCGEEYVPPTPRTPQEIFMDMLEETWENTPESDREALCTDYQLNNHEFQLEVWEYYETRENQARWAMNFFGEKCNSDT